MRGMTRLLYSLLLQYPAYFLTIILLPRKSWNETSGLIDFGPLIYWALQWLNFWILTVACILYWKTRDDAPRQFYAMVVLWLFCVIFALPKYERSGYDKKFGVYHYIRYTIDNYHFDHFIYFKLKSERTFDNITLKKGTKVHLNEDGTLKSAELVEPHQVGELWIEGDLKIYESGVIEKITLSRAAEIHGYPCAPGLVEFYEDAELVEFTLSAPHLFGQVKIPAGVSVRLSGGNLWRAQARTPVDIQGIHFAGEDHSIYFFPSGKIKSGYLAIDSTLSGFPLEGGMLFEFNEKGELMNGWLTKKYVIFGIPVIRKFEFTEDRKHLKSVTLAEDHTIQGFPISAGEYVEFHENGMLRHTVVSRPVTYRGHRFEVGEDVFLDEEGNIQR